MQSCSRLGLSVIWIDKNSILPLISTVGTLQKADEYG